jgi:hypothetical protein
LLAELLLLQSFWLLAGWLFLALPQSLDRLWLLSFLVLFKVSGLKFQVVEDEINSENLGNTYVLFLFEMLII